MEDTEIIKLYFARQEAAVTETSKKYGAYLNQVADHILRSREDTEEVVSDTYLAAWNAIPPQRPRVLRHFLSRITRNLALDRLDYLTAGRRNRNMNVLLSELEACLPDQHSNPETILETKELGAAINRFLGTQSKADCALFLHRYYHSMTVAELMKTYGLSEGTVKYRLSCLRRRLKKHLSQEGIVV